MDSLLISEAVRDYARWLILTNETEVALQCLALKQLHLHHLLLELLQAEMLKVALLVRLPVLWLHERAKSHTLVSQD